MKVIAGTVESACKVCVYGVEGIGKSTFASKFPAPLFIDTEGGTKRLNVDRTQRPQSWAELMGLADEFRRGEHGYKTLVIDTADWAERLCLKQICDKAKVCGIEDFGYGKGYVYAQEEFGKLLNLLEEIVEGGRNVILTAHARIRKIEQPEEVGGYDHWEMKTSKNVAPLIKEWADMLLFANYKTMVINVDGKGASKGKNKAQGNVRVIYTDHSPCWDAKNRFGLPDELPFEYAAIASCIEQGERATQMQSEKTETIAAQKAPAVPEPPVAPETQGFIEPEPDLFKGTPFGDAQEQPEPENDGIPEALKRLMEQCDVSEEDIISAVAEKGYFPGDMRVRDYPEDFVKGVLIGAWDQVYGVILTTKRVPF